MPSQSQTLRLYTALALHREDWAGQLLLHIGLNEPGRELALASLAAGAAALFLEENTQQLREANREGCLTFTVTTLDEALRALKNEIRQKRAITIGLAGSSTQWLSEMVERGVLPTAITASRPLTEAEQTPLQTLQQWGVQPLHASGLTAINKASRHLEAPQASLQARIAENTAATLQDRRSKDETLRTQLSEDLPQALQKRWFDTAPTLFPRSLSRAYWTAL